MTTTSHMNSMSSSSRLIKTDSRGSMMGSPRFSTATSASLDDMTIKTWILNSSTIDNVTYYRILVRRGATNVIKESKRRYTDFLEFKESLLDLFDTLPTCPRCENIAKVVADFEFPKKHYFSSKSKVVINYRMQAFRSFVSLVVAKVFNPSPKCPTCGGQVVTLVLRFLLQNATVLPENQVPRDSVFVRDSSMTTPTSTKSECMGGKVPPRGFHMHRRSTSGPPPVMNPLATQPAAIRSTPGFQSTSIGRFSVPCEEMEERDPSMRIINPPQPQPEQPRPEAIVSRREQEAMYFDSFLADKDDKLPSPMNVAKPAEIRRSEDPVPHSNSRTRVSSVYDDDDDDEIDMSGLHLSADPAAKQPTASTTWAGWDAARQ